MAYILIADDDPIQLDLRKSFLETVGHEIAIAFSVRQTITAIEKRTPDLIILDLRFPNAEGQSDSQEGLALIRRIRDRDPSTPILVLSGWPDDLDGRPERTLVSRVLLKPLKTAELVETVREMIT